MKKTLLIIALSFCLEACVPAALIVGATAGGAIVYDQRNVSTMIDDKDIAYRAQTKLNQDEELAKSAHISVATFNHNVLLVGQAPTSALKSRAEDIVRTISKVNRVFNEIAIENPSSMIASTNDTWLTTKVKSVLLAEKGLNSTQIKIVTENGVVYMMGLLTHSQADLATTCVQKVDGVQKIVKLFEYQS